MRRGHVLIRFRLNGWGITVLLLWKQNYTGSRDPRTREGSDETHTRQPWREKPEGSVSRLLFGENSIEAISDDLFLTVTQPQ